ncbi:hypothetical protein Q5P01_026030 [Channa striata]|uniref:C-type lectin domain-containing protein n=1 Tax=Channa striata TaxID=64152 RepID=A0AA88IFM6_CHASR|nr:hypothetical protein Q5P01_026030 [Channa striata]
MAPSLVLCAVLCAVLCVGAAAGNRFPPTTTPTTTPTTPLSNTPITGTGIFTTPTPTTITTTPTSTSPLRNTSSLMQVFTSNYSTPAPPPQPTGNPSRPSPSQQMCPEGWEVFQGRCYYFVNQPLSWPEAQSNCALLESMLASVHSPQEYNFLQQFTNSNGNEEAWLGGFYLQYQWLWIDGSWFYNNSWNNASTDSSSPCLLLNSNEPWSNSPCNTFGTPGICVKNSNVPPAMACPEGWTVFQGRCYYYNEVSMSWPEADASCASLGASLVSVHSPQEYMFLLQQTFSPSWLGGFYIDDQWMWLDGSWFYEGFFGQTPPPSTYQCLSTFNPDGWSPYSCNQIMPSFCMKEALSYRH